MGDNRISHDFALRLFCLDFSWIPGWEEGGSLQFIESHGFDLALEGILVSHSLWYAKLTSGFWKRKSLHILFSTWCIFIPKSAHSCLQANSFVSFQNVQWYTVSSKSTSSCQHLKHSVVFSFFLSFFHLRLFLDGHGENKRHVNPTTKNLCYTEACSLNIKHW